MKRNLLSRFVLNGFAWTLVGLASVAVAADALDWPHWRGPEQNGVSRETGLIDKFDPNGGDGSNVAWKRTDLPGRSTPIVLNGKLYSLFRADAETNREGERVVCLDAATGKTVWEQRFNVWLSDVPDTRVGWSSVVGDPESGHIYALGVCGLMQCLDGNSGKVLWSVPMHEQFGLLSTYGGRTNFPVLFEDLVIVSAVMTNWGDLARPAHRFVAFDKKTGAVRWLNGTRLAPEDTTYSSPFIAPIAGQMAMVFGSGDGSVWAFQPRTGQKIWEFRYSKRGVNTAPVVIGDNVYISHSEENFTLGNTMGALSAINGVGKGDITATGELWRVPEWMQGRAQPLHVSDPEFGDRLYCFDDGMKLIAVDLKSGKLVAPKKGLGTILFSNPLLADKKIYAATTNGRWFILKPTMKGFDIVSKGQFPNIINGEECLASPIASHGRVFWQTTDALYCLADPTKQPGSAPRPEPAKETPVSADEKPAFVQLSPAELLLAPGGQQKFAVRVFNSAGQLLKESPAEFAVQGVGSIDAGGTFTAPTDAAHVAAFVSAKVGTLTGQARVRIVPPLPWKFDFDNQAEPPVTWIGARYRHVLREVDGSKVMVKVTTIPKGTRSRAWFGQSDLHDYTIQADVKGAIKDNKTPDIGLIAQGYVLDMQGRSQKLEIRIWDPQRNRLAASVPFAWQPNKWYTMKHEARLEETKGADGKSTVQAVLRGKVWPRGEKEPEAWTITATDPAPNLSGSPGLFGNANDAEIYLDNITVATNAK